MAATLVLSMYVLVIVGFLWLMNEVLPRRTKRKIARIFQLETDDC